MTSSGVVSRQRVLLITKEVFRKSIHLCSCIVPFLMEKSYYLVLVLLSLALAFYSFCEYLRLKGKVVPLISAVTAAASRKRDENRFVLGPVTLCAGIITASVLFELPYARIGIFALAFGDGIASLAGKLFGKVHLPLTQGKTAAGSLSCFAAIFISCYLCCKNCSASLIIASVGMFIELLPLKDLDNIFIPVLLSLLAKIIL